VREENGDFRQFGRVPDKGKALRMRAYRTGGGVRGNVGRGALSVLKSSIPYVSKVVNRRAAAGGADGEDIDNAKVRGPIVLRTKGRAVTAEDYEYLAKEAAPGAVARIHCVTAGDGDGADAAGVRVLVVPAASSRGGQIAFSELVPSEEVLRRISHRLDECRVIGSRVLVAPPRYTGVTVVADLVAQHEADIPHVEEGARRALYTYLNPIIGGPSGNGWPLGRPVNVGEIYSVLQRLRGLDLIDDVKLFSVDLDKRARSRAPLPRVDLGPHDLVLSYEHLVRVRTTTT
jgi:predicted phage baseplate assembly protein